ncbi:MAG: hypothetical protein H8E36_16175 [Rhodospirillaceae bacterium]|nr:hypothetical protein [Rhodospirillaceae bacterium]MBL6931384.1 hypothetical protein [Rhodospirillales bacterium]
MKKEPPTPSDVARKLVEIYERPFGGKPTGRYRISPKNLRSLMQRRRISDEIVRLLTEEMFELGFVFIDMESFFVVTSARTHTNYRRVPDSMVKQADDEQ